MIPLVQLFAPFFDMIKNCSTFFRSYFSGQKI